MTYGQLFMILNPNVKVVENGTCVWIYFDSANHDTLRVEWWNKEMPDEALKTQEPQPPKHIHEEYPEHDWERKKDGSIDEFAIESGFHNGPRCKRCNDSFCVHCEPDGYETHKPCIVDEDRCPECGRELFPPWGKARKITYCMDCGQAVKWCE